MTDPAGKQAGRKVMRLAVVEGFHGRTEGPARTSHSCRASYVKHLASYRDSDNLLFVPINDLAALRKTFADAEKNGIFFEAFFVEPVMGEGIPGLGLAREYYDEARALTTKMGSLLVVDSIQAALRAQGCLSIVDYNGYETCVPPDMETFSKALNAGQYPLSVIALSGPVAAQYVTGLYGNTMTGNPRAMEVGCTVLDSVTDAVRENIRARGLEFIEKFKGLAAEFLNDGVFDLEGFIARRGESHLIDSLHAIALREMGIEDLDQHPQLKNALIQAYQLGVET
jgi:acetylornithine/succinyldiaminopimelate/putrescine aminotransferase